MLREQDNPPIVYPEQAELATLPGTWWVAHTKPRQEKSLAHDLIQSRVAYFLPMYEAKRTSRGRSWKTKLPLFPSYLFVCGQESERVASLKTGRVLATIPVPDQAKLVVELAAIQRLIVSGVGVDPYPALKRGSLCRVRSGPLQGIEGRVTQRQGATRFVVEVSILGQGAAVTIDGGLLEPVE